MCVCVLYRENASFFFEISKLGMSSILNIFVSYIKKIKIKPLANLNFIDWVGMKVEGK